LSSELHGRQATERGAWSQLRASVLRASLALVPKERHRVFALTVLLGGVCGLVAVSFHLAIRGAEHLLIENAMDAGGVRGVIWTILTPTLGGLLAGWLLYYVAPRARGSGIPQVKYVYAVKSGRLRLRDAVSKFVIATLQIGSGSALGREGPTVHICAAVASSFGRLFALSPQNQRRLIPVGAAAGIAAAFNAPIAAVTFVIEEIIGDLDQTVLSGVVIAAALAAVIERSVLGTHPVLGTQAGYGLEHPSSLLIYALLGLAAGIVSCAYYPALLRLRGFVNARTGRFGWAWPSVGGLVTGLIAAGLLFGFGARGVTSDGYTTLTAALRGELPVGLMLGLVAAKLVCSVFSYSTGGAGGIFAPVLFVGAMLGGSFGHVDRVVLDHPNAQLGAFALVGMGAFFAAVIRAPITSVLIIFEMTGGYGLVLPLMIANTVAYGVARRFEHVPIYEALLHQDRLYLPDKQRVTDALSALQVRDAMTTELVVLPDDMLVIDGQREVAERSFSQYPVVDASGRLCGLVSQARLDRRVAAGHGALTLGEVAQARECLSADQALVDAAERMQQLGARQLIVVAESGSTVVVGMLALSDIMRVYVRTAKPAADA
jgi:CIC family chloride channel protein